VLWRKSHEWLLLSLFNSSWSICHKSPFRKHMFEHILLDCSIFPRAISHSGGHKVSEGSKNTSWPVSKKSYSGACNSHDLAKKSCFSQLRCRATWALGLVAAEEKNVLVCLAQTKCFPNWNLWIMSFHHEECGCWEVQNNEEDEELEKLGTCPSFKLIHLFWKTFARLAFF